jgi:hypothetical protein
MKEISISQYCGKCKDITYHRLIGKKVVCQKHNGNGINNNNKCRAAS